MSRRKAEANFKWLRVGKKWVSRGQVKKCNMTGEESGSNRSEL